MPVHVVTGAGGPELVARLLRERSDWAALRPRACPCCAGRVELQVMLARLLRERRPARVLMELADGEHLSAIEGVLAERPLGEYVVPARTLVLPADERVRSADLDEV